VRASAWLLAASLAASTACSKNPATGKLQFNLMSEQEEITLGKDAHDKIEQSMPIYAESAVLTKLVDDVGQKLAAASERPGLPWTFTILDDPVVNAFALPGGYIYVTRGLLGHLNSEDELAAVLAHEAGHVTARHSAVQMRKTKAAERAVGVFGVLPVLGGVAARTAGLALLKYSRDDENEADDLSIRYVERTGYDAAAVPEVFAVLADVSEGSHKVPAWLKTHPEPEARRQRIGQQIGKMGRDVVDGEYLTAIEGLVYGVDPRNGFLFGVRFIHPRAGFQIDLPEKWSVEHDAKSVVALSDDEAALIVIGPSEYETAQSGVESFFEGDIARGDLWKGEIGGYRVITAAFSIPTDSGALGGLIAFVDYEGRVLVMIAAAAQAAWAGRAEIVAASFASFRRIGDEKLANVPPMRIKTTVLPSDMTLAEFNRVQPSVVHIAELARINHVQADESLPKGRLVKRVVGFNPAAIRALD
jgi:predicted Zn-dependent protease